MTTALEDMGRSIDAISSMTDTLIAERDELKCVVTEVVALRDRWREDLPEQFIAALDRLILR